MEVYDCICNYMEVYGVYEGICGESCGRVRGGGGGRGGYGKGGRGEGGGYAEGGYEEGEYGVR